MPARKHSAWLSELNQGLMVVAQAQIYDDLFFYSRPYEVQRMEEKFYQKPKDQDTNLIPFGLKHIAAQFIILGLGFFVAFGTFLYECKKVSAKNKK